MDGDNRSIDIHADAIASGVGEAFAAFLKRRNPDRIDYVLALVSEIWHKHPDLRLMELFENVGTGSNCCMYYMEDDELVDRLRQTYGP